MTQEILVEVAQIANTIEAIDMESKLSLKQLADKINEIVAKVNELQSSNVAVRDRGPKSEKDMSEDDARLVMIGELKDVSHKECAAKLGLSYGQIYSARKGFTFKTIYKEMMALSN